MRYVIALAAIPAAVWAAWPSPRSPVAVKAVETEGVRARRMDSETFRARWSSVGDLPPATVIRNVEISQPPAPVAKPPRARVRVVRTRRASLTLDLCQRHKMHKVYYGRRWRCRR